MIVIELARAKKGALNMASAGPGSQSHLAGALLLSLGKFDSLHVPFKGGAAVPSVMTGESHWSINPAPSVIGMLKGGQVRPLAVAAARRLPALPDVPTAAEAGMRGYESAAWFAFLAPRATPRPIIERLHKEIAAAIADPAIRARFADLGAEPINATPEETARHIGAEIAKWREIIGKAGIKLD